uniref:Uncharacterized protein n=1 Tax=Rousettus aegyptiacus TaxID=9407 RepID=A0A7J8C277_ROUAE|nr:hypothetical protein HJG63_009268 [Rousettus aegyptiacus]
MRKKGITMYGPRCRNAGQNGSRKSPRTRQPSGGGRGRGCRPRGPPVLACDQLLRHRRGESGLTVSSGPPGSRGAVTSPPVLPSPTWKLFGCLHPTLYRESSLSTREQSDRVFKCRTR